MASYLEPGQTSDILRSDAGFHIVHMIERQQSVLSRKTRSRHILIRVDERTSDEEAKLRINELYRKLQAGEDFAALAKANSQDLSAARGGDLGWVDPANMVPEFAKAMNQLELHAISQPVRTPFGWHIIQVLDRGKADVQSRQRDKARQTLLNRKAQEIYADWVQQLRAAAYVTRPVADE